MWREPPPSYGPTQLHRYWWCMGMVVGSPKTERAAQSLGATPSVGWPLVLASAWWIRDKKRIFVCGENDSARETTTRCARLSAAPRSPVTPTSPPAWVWALPTVSSAGDVLVTGLRLARTLVPRCSPNGYLRPAQPPFIVTRAPRRERQI
jgi:hypothetical protein